METAARVGDWIETYTGRQFYPLDPRPEDVDIRDIAHALSLICRYNGHVRHHYSVAQHSVLCAEQAMKMGLSPEMQLYALLHDAAEAYVCDIPKPLKSDLGGYGLIEGFVEHVIFTKYGLPDMKAAEHATIKQIDDHVLYNEAKHLLSKAAWVPTNFIPDITIAVIKILPEDAERLFLEMFKYLRNAINN